MKPVLPALYDRIGIFSLKDNEGNILVCGHTVCCCRWMKPELIFTWRGVTVLKKTSQRWIWPRSWQLLSSGMVALRDHLSLWMLHTPWTCHMASVVLEVMVIIVIPNSCHSLTVHFGTGSGRRASFVPYNLLHNLRWELLLWFHTLQNRYQRLSHLPKASHAACGRVKCLVGPDWTSVPQPVWKCQPLFSLWFHTGIAAFPTISTNNATFLSPLHKQPPPHFQGKLPYSV